VCCVAAETGAGVPELLEVLARVMPSPAEANPAPYVRGEGDDAQGAAVEPDAAAENAQANANQAMAPRNERDVDAAAEAEAEPMAEPPEAAARAADVAFAPPMRRRHVRVYAHDNPGSSADTPAAGDDFTASKPTPARVRPPLPLICRTA